MTQRNILLISYVFPPYPGIGGRRWAKFTKHLAKKDYTIHVICAKNKEEETSIWLNDVQNERIKIYPLDVFYPKSFSFTNYSKSIDNRIAFRFWKLFFTLCSKGVIYDRTFFWKEPLLKKAKQIISDHKIKNIIVTIPPFRLAYYALSLKTFNKNLNLIIDYRDPWTNNNPFYGFKNLPLNRLNHEKKMEMEVLQNANYVISVNQQMTNWAKEKLGSNQEKCITIGNGYDADDIKIFSHNKKENNRKIFLYAGSLYTYNELEYIFVPFVEFIKKKEQENQNFSNKYSFEFYGNIEPSYYYLLKKNQVKSISFNAPISREKLNEKYNNADYFMMFTVRTHAYAFNSKFCEYLAYKKPIIHFSNDGPVTQFLETYQLGLGVRPHTFIQDMERLFSLIESESLSYNFNFDTTQFSIERLTEKLEQLFI